MTYALLKKPFVIAVRPEAEPYRILPNKRGFERNP
jgi:hypothetical protein